MKKNSQMRVCVVGLGKIGMPLAAQFASKGSFVYGADINEKAVDLFANGKPLPYLAEPDVDKILEEAHKKNLLKATTDTAAAVRECEVIVVVVPVLVEKIGSSMVTDMKAMIAATKSIAKGLQKGSLVCYETTLPVGTTRKVLSTLLEQESKLTANEDFFVAFSPENVFSGRILYDLRRWPKVVGGTCAKSTALAEKFYKFHLDCKVITVASAEAAELSKLASTSYRDVSIAFANDLARIADCHDINVYEVIEASNTLKGISNILWPGVGVGGHCIPVYPYLLAENVPPECSRLNKIARVCNDDMAEYAIHRMECFCFPETLRNKRFLILGLSYRGDVKEKAFSSCYLVCDAITRRGGVPLVHDPLFTEQEILSEGLNASSMYNSVDGIVLQAGHSEYLTIQWNQYLPSCKVVLDGRGFVDPAVIPLEITYLRIGQPPRLGTNQHLIV